ncbi:MAG: annexin [Deltaproteobacteria bacterium]|jgi:hypothetical protein
MAIETHTALNPRSVHARSSHSAANARLAGSPARADDLRIRMGGSEAERQHYVVILTQSGFDQIEAAPLGDAIARDLRGRAPRPNQQIPFYDPRLGALDTTDFARFFIAFGVDPRTAQAAAEMLTQLITAAQFYQPFYQSIGGQGAVDFDRLAQLYQRQAPSRAPAQRPAVRAAPIPVAAQAQQAKVAQKADQAQATRDAVALHQAMDGWGTDEAALTRILSGRSNTQINAIKAAYQEMYGESLEDAIKGDTSGDFEDSLLSMLRGNRDESGKVDENAATRDAAALHEAMDGWGTDEATLNRIISGRSGPQLKAIAKAYQEMYGESLEDAIKGDTSGDFEDSLLAQLKRADTAPKKAAPKRVDLRAELAARRSNGRLQGQMTAGGAPRVDKGKATRDAVALHEAIDGLGTDEQKLIDVLSNRTNREIRAIRSAYQEMFGESLDDAIKGDTSGDLETMLLTLASGNRDESGTVDQAQATRDAVALHQAIDGWGTDEAALIRILGKRSKGQLAATAKAYEAMYGESLQDAVKGDTSGWFETSLLAQL